MRDCIRESSTSVWVAAAGLIAERYGAMAHARWSVLGVSARGWVSLLVAFLLFVSTWHSLSRRGLDCTACKIRSAMLPVALWTFGWYSFALVPLEGYLRLRLVSFAVLAVLPAIGQFAVCGFWNRVRSLYWLVLYLSAALLLVLYPFLPGAHPGRWTVAFFLAILSAAVVAGDGGSWRVSAVVFLVSFEIAILTSALGVRSSMVRGIVVLLGYLTVVWFLQATSRSSDRVSGRPRRLVQESS